MADVCIFFFSVFRRVNFLSLLDLYAEVEPQRSEYWTLKFYRVVLLDVQEEGSIIHFIQISYLDVAFSFL